MKSRAIERGFTLLEVLVASVIFISSIAAISMAYRGALLASDRANYNVSLSGTMPMILTSVQLDIRSDQSQTLQLNGSGTSWGVDYEWSAELLEFKAAPAQIDLDLQTIVQPNPRFKLWGVTLVTQYQGFERTYRYNELSWLNEK